MRSCRNGVGNALSGGQGSMLTANDTREADSMRAHTHTRKQVLINTQENQSIFRAGMAVYNLRSHWQEDHKLQTSLGLSTVKPVLKNKNNIGGRQYFTVQQCLSSKQQSFCLSSLA